MTDSAAPRMTKPINPAAALLIEGENGRYVLAMEKKRVFSFLNADARPRLEVNIVSIPL
jgi:hypothetical protein